MRDMAEQADASDQSWVPENYRRDSLEETTKVLLKSQKEAQRAMTEAMTARRDLERRNAELEAALIAQVEPQMYEQSAYDESMYVQPSYEQPQIDPRQIADIAAQAVQAKLVEPQAAAFVASAEQIASQVPGYSENRESVMAAVQANPGLVYGALATGDPAQLAGALANVHQSLAGPSQAEVMRTMKIQAQSAMGAGGRTLGVTDGEQRWHEIATANDGKLGL